MSRRLALAAFAIAAALPWAGSADTKTGSAAAPLALPALPGADKPAEGAAQMDPEALAALARFKAATGGQRWDAVHSLHTRGTMSTGGLFGPFETWEELTSGRSSSRFALGPVAGAEGFDGEAPWSQDPSGEVTIDRGPEALEAARNDAYRSALAWWFPGRWPARVRFLGERQQEGGSFIVVEITPRGGRGFELWLDGGSGLAVRAIERGGMETITTTFGEWRPLGAADASRPPLRLPFLVRANTGNPKYDVVLHAAAIDIDPPLTADTFAAPARRAADFSIAAADGRAIVPCALRNNHVYLDVRIDGKGPLRMLLDSGGFNVLTPAAAQGLGIAAQGALQARGVGAASADVALGRVGELRFGDVALRDQIFYVLPLAGMDEDAGAGVAGIIGFEVLKRLVVEIDYARRRLTFTLPERFDPTGAGVLVPFVLADHMPAVEGSIDGIPGRFTIDTGSRSTIALHQPFVAGHHLIDHYRPQIEAVTGWGVGGGVRARVARGRMLVLGTVEVPTPVVELVTSDKGALADRYLAGNVGGGVLRRFRVTFDYRHERLFLAPGDGESAVDPYDHAGLWLDPVDGGLEVADVIPGGPGARAGIGPGDLLLADAGATREALRARLRQAPPGTRTTLRVRGPAGERQVEVVLDELPPAPP